MFEGITNEAIRLYEDHRRVYHNVTVGQAVPDEDVCRLCRSLRRAILGGFK